MSISIHALRKEGDCTCSRLRRSRTKFLSTPSARRATGLLKLVLLELGISIHALREEGDPMYPRDVSLPAGISIHALREEGDSGTPFRWPCP